MVGMLARQFSPLSLLFSEDGLGAWKYDVLLRFDSGGCRPM